MLTEIRRVILEPSLEDPLNDAVAQQFGSTLKTIKDAEGKPKPRATRRPVPQVQLRALRI